MEAMEQLEEAEAHREELGADALEAAIGIGLGGEGSTLGSGVNRRRFVYGGGLPTSGAGPSGGDGSEARGGLSLRSLLQMGLAQHAAGKSSPAAGYTELRDSEPGSFAVTRKKSATFADAAFAESLPSPSRRRMGSRPNSARSLLSMSDASERDETPRSGSPMMSSWKMS